MKAEWQNGVAECKCRRRFRGYDYSRGAAVFVTVALEPRRPAFGRVADGRVALSPAGEIAARALERESARTPDVRLMRSVVMPDHVHFRLHLRAGQSAPLRKLGRFVYNFKAWTRRDAARTGVEIGWQKNYHDRICVSREVIDLVDKYIENNPRKWSLMHGNPPPLKVVEPLSSPLLPAEEWWTGVGRIDWLAPSPPLDAAAPRRLSRRGQDDEGNNQGGRDEGANRFGGESAGSGGRRYAAVRLSRSIPPSAFGGVVARLAAAAEAGWILFGTWISPCERAVFAELSRRGFPLARGSQDPLEMVYRPKEDEPPMFAEGRYLVLSRVFADRSRRGVGWHGMNDALAALATAAGGVSLYVRQPPGGGELKWEFSKAPPLDAAAPCGAGTRI